MNNTKDFDTLKSFFVFVSSVLSLLFFFWPPGCPLSPLRPLDTSLPNFLPMYYMTLGNISRPLFFDPVSH